MKIQIDIKFSDTSHSLTLRPARGDIFIFYEVLAFNAYHLPDTFAQTQTIKTIVDCGANIGLTSIFFANRYPDARIIALEPHPDNFEILEKNVDGWDKIQPLQAAIVGRSRPTAYLTSSHPAWGNRIATYPTDDECINVPALTIAEMMDRMEIQNIDLLKIDIEGGEEELFDNTDFLQKTNLVLIELHGDYTLRKFQAALDAAGFAALAGGVAPGVRLVTARPRGT